MGSVDSWSNQAIQRITFDAMTIIPPVFHTDCGSPGNSPLISVSPPSGNFSISDCTCNNEKATV